MKPVLISLFRWCSLLRLLNSLLLLKSCAAKRFHLSRSYSKVHFFFFLSDHFYLIYLSISFQEADLPGKTLDAWAGLFLLLCFGCMRKNKWRYTFLITHREISTKPMRVPFLSFICTFCRLCQDPPLPDLLFQLRFGPSESVTAAAEWTRITVAVLPATALPGPATHAAPGTAVTLALRLCQAAGADDYTEVVPWKGGSSGESHLLCPPYCYCSSEGSSSRLGTAAGTIFEVWLML